MVQNICKKFLLLLMFSLLRVDVLSMEGSLLDDSKGNKNNENNEEINAEECDEKEQEQNNEEMNAEEYEYEDEQNNEEMNAEEYEYEDEQNNEEGMNGEEEKGEEEGQGEGMNGEEENGEQKGPYNEEEEKYEEEQQDSKKEEHDEENNEYEGEEERNNEQGDEEQGQYEGEWEEQNKYKKLIKENINNNSENNSIYNKNNLYKDIKEESYLRPNDKRGNLRTFENLRTFKNDRINLGNADSDILFWGDNEYANDPEERVMDFIKKEVKQEEIEKNNEKTLVVLDILKDVNDSFKEKKSKEGEARINNQLTSINNNQAFEEEDFNINKNDDVNTIREVNSILDKRIEKNPELNELKDKQRKKDLNGAINSYYELCQAVKSTEREIAKENEGLKEKKKELKKVIGKEVEIEKNLEKDEELSLLKMKNEKNKKQLKKIEQDENGIEKNKKIAVEFVSDVFNDIFKNKKKEEEEKKEENKINKSPEIVKEKDELSEYDEETGKKIRKKNNNKGKIIDSLEEPSSKEEKKEEENKEELNIKENKEEIIDTKKKEEGIEIIENNNIEEKEKNEESIEELLARLKSEKEQKKKDLEEGIKKLNELKEEKKRTLFHDLKKAEEEIGLCIDGIMEKVNRLEMKKEKLDDGLKEVEKRIMTLSPSSEELNSAIKNIKEREKENQNGVLLDVKFLKDLKDKVKEEQKIYNNERVFQEFENNIKVLDKYLKSNTGIEKRGEKIMGVDIKDQNKISKTQNKGSKDQNKESKDQNKISEEKTDGFLEYIDKSTDNMKKMVEENTFNDNDEEWKNEILRNIYYIKQIREDINENQRKDPYIKEWGKNEIICSCKIIEKLWKKCNNKENYNNKQKGTRPEENIEEEGRVLKGQQHRKDKFLEKLHRFENFVENCDFGTTQIEQSENSIEDENTNKKVLKEKEGALKEEDDENILNKKEEILNEKKEEENKEELINIKEKESKIENNNTGNKEEIIDTKEKEEENGNKNIIENNNIEEKEKNEELIDAKDKEEKIDNIEEEKGAINNQKHSTEEIISKGHLFEDDEKELLLGGCNWHFDEDGKIILGKDEEEIENDKDKNDNDKNDDKSLINLIESPAYKDMKNRALMKGKGKEKQKDEKNGYDNINNAESVLKEELQLDRRDKMKKIREVTKKQFYFYGKILKEEYPNLFKKNDNYIKTVNNVIKKEEEKYEKLINTWKKKISKISSLILLRGFGRFAVSFLFSTINSIMQFERKDVIGPYFSFYTLSFGKIVQPSFLRKNIYIDISLSLLSLLIFSAVDSKIDRYYLLKYKITSPLCRFLSLIKYTTNAFNININFFVNEDFYMSFNIMSIFDSIISWYWFNNFKEQVNKDIIEECDKKIKSIKKGSKPNYEILETMLKKQGERLIKRRKLNFFRRMLASDLVKESRNKEEQEGIEEIYRQLNEEKEEINNDINGNNEKTIFKKNRNSNELEKIEEKIIEEDNNKDSDDNINQL